MLNSVIAQGLARQQACPEIHKKVKKLKGTKTGFDQSVSDMVTDLKEAVPELSTRQLSSLVGVSRSSVMRILDTTVSEERWTVEDNPGSCAAELTALTLHHPDRQYEDHIDAANEYSGTPVLFTAPLPQDRFRPADQSHTVRRPVTLATQPFRWAA